MCLIIVSRDGNNIPEKHLAQAWKENNDGFGIMWFDGSKPQVYRAFTLKAMRRAIRKVSGLPHVVHFRYATHGTKTLANVHPFKVNDMMLMHNGIIHIDCSEDPSRSDTWHFAKNLNNWGISSIDMADENSEVRKEIMKTIGFGNKLVFMSDTGEIHIVNEKAGTWKDGFWYSNSSVLREVTSYQYRSQGKSYCGYTNPARSAGYSELNTVPKPKSMEEISDADEEFEKYFGYQSRRDRDRFDAVKEKSDYEKYYLERQETLEKLFNGGEIVETVAGLPKTEVEAVSHNSNLVKLSAIAEQDSLINEILESKSKGD